MIYLKLSLLIIVSAFASFFIRAALILYAEDFVFLGGAFFGAFVAFSGYFLAHCHLEKQKSAVKNVIYESFDHD
jgi:hypothetical protein